MANKLASSRQVLWSMQMSSPNGQLIQAVLKDAPLRMMLLAGDGAISAEIIELVRMLNGSCVGKVLDFIQAIRNK